MSDRAGKALCGTVIVFGGWALRHYLGWDWWLAYAVSAGSAFVIGFAALAIADTWPLAVPYDLRERVDELAAQGWRTARVHPWWRCENKRPHVHMINPRAVRIARERVVREDEKIAPLPGS